MNYTTRRRSHLLAPKGCYEVPVRRLYRMFGIAVLAVLSSLAMPSTVDAAINKLTVSVRVMSFMRIRTQNQSRKLVITDTDIDNGYVDIYSGTRYYIQTNVSDDYVIEFSPLTGIFDKVVVSDGTKSGEFESSGGCVYMTYTGGRSGEVKDLDYRIYLGGDVRPGTYPWPLAMQFAAY
jgi:hypothetical protein